MFFQYGMALVSQIGLAGLKQLVLGIAGRAVSETAFSTTELYRIMRRYRLRAATRLTGLF